MEPREIDVKIVQKLLRRKVVGAHNKQIDTVKNWFRSSDQGVVEERIEALLTAGTVIERYGGQRDAIRLVSVSAAKRFIRARGGELPWGYRDE